MNEKNKKGMLFSGIVMMTIAIAMFLILPQTVVGKSNEQAIIGAYSEDTGGYAKHPADDSSGALVVVVASKYNSETDAYNIRFGYSANSGVSWQGFEWVASSPNEQDHPDVRILHENGDTTRIIVVWQERTDENNPWKIKASTKSYSQGSWGTVIDISDIYDQNDNMYPKIDVSLGGSGGGQGYYHYWNIVWQREDDSNNWGVKMYSRYYTSGNPTEHINDIVSGSPGSYRHPAITCTLISGGDCEVHIVYDAYISSTHYVQVQSGWVSTNAVYTKYNNGPYNLDSDSFDSHIGFPDITCSGPGGGSGHPSQSGNADVWIVWHHVENSNNKVKRAYSNDSLGSVPSVVPITTSNGPSTSAALRCVAVAMLESGSSPIAVVWTDDSDIYYVRSSNWTVQHWTSTNNTDIHVDVSITSISYPPYTNYAHVVWQRNVQTIYYARDP